MRIAASVVDTLPRNPSGKIRKDLLRQDIRERIEKEKEQGNDSKY